MRLHVQFVPLTVDNRSKFMQVTAEAFRIACLTTLYYSYVVSSNIFFTNGLHKLMYSCLVKKMSNE